MKRRRNVVLLAALALVLWACQRQAGIPTPQQGLLVDAETALRARDYPRADTLYGNLIEIGSPGQREISLARRAFIRAIPGTDFHSPIEAEAFLDQLAAEFPETMLGIETEALLDVLPEIESLRLAVARSRDEASELRQLVDITRQERELFTLFMTYASPFDPAFDIEEARAEYRRLVASFPDSLFREVAERILFLLSQWERLEAVEADNAATLEALRIEVSALSEELEQLKEIDLGRRLPTDGR